VIIWESVGFSSGDFELHVAGGVNRTSAIFRISSPKRKGLKQGDKIFSGSECVCGLSNVLPV